MQYIKLNPVNPIVHFRLRHTAHCAEKAHRFCMSRKGETGEGGWGHPLGDVHMVAAKLGCKNTMVPGGPILSVTAWTGLENTTLTL